MDFVTHACVGALVGRAIAPAEDAPLARSCVRLGALMALLPDGDHVLELVSAEAYLVHHRQLTHSLLFTGALTVAMLFVGDKAGRARRTAVTGGALASHLLLDLLTPFGTGVLWPFANKLAWDGLQLVAPWLIALCVLAAAFASWKGRQKGGGRKVALVGLAVIGTFLGAEWTIARTIAPAAEPGALVVALPSWSKPWQGVSFVVEGERLLHRNHGIGGGALQEVPPPERFGREPPAAVVEAAKHAAARYLSKLRLPVAREPWEGGFAAEVEEGAQVVFEDAQFWAIDPGKPPFRIMVTAAGKVSVWEQARPLQLVLWALVVAVTAGLTWPRREAPAPAASEEGAEEAA